MIVTGASSLIGHFLLPRLTDAGFEVMAISRRLPIPQSIKGQASVRWHQIGQSLAASEPPLFQASTLIHLAPLWLLPGWLQDFAGLDGRRVVAFSSTSRFSKLSSPVAEEHNVAKALAAAELDVAAICKRLQIVWTVFRPTLVYGAGLDRNVSTVVSFVRRWGFFFIVGNGDGLRQPVHADDLAAACLSVATCKATFNRTYNLVGGDTLTYREMIEAIFVALGRRPRTISIPEALFKAGVQVLTCFPSYRHLTPEMVTRMRVDLCFDSSEARQDFCYAPKGFREGIELELAPCVCG